MEKIEAMEDIDYDTIRYYFAEMESLCTVDNGQLWGTNLYGPIMFVIPESRIIIANQSDNDGKLSEHEGVFVGKLPENISIANYSFNWNGKRWVMINWNDSTLKDMYSRNKLMIHESWHNKIEDKIGIFSIITSNFHLDNLQGSILLKLELCALREALMANNTHKKRTHLKDALVIRKYRQILFPENNENDFELHEGMPEYTGFKLCGLDEEILPKIIAKLLDVSEEKKGLANSFAYLTGPAYGFIFDNLNVDWIKQILNGKNIIEITEEVVMAEIPSDNTHLKVLVEKIGTNYNYENLIKNETMKFKQQENLRNLYKAKLIEGNQLIIRNNNIKFTFNPQEKLIPIDNGVVYKTMKLIGEWGILNVNNGIYRSNDWQVFIVSAPKVSDSNTINENDYVLTLNKGWVIIEVKEGKYTFVKSR